MNSSQHAAAKALIAASHAEQEREKAANQNAVFKTLRELVRNDLAKCAYQQQEKKERQQAAYEAVRQVILSGRR